MVHDVFVNLVDSLQLILFWGFLHFPLLSSSQVVHLSTIIHLDLANFCKCFSNYCLFVCCSELFTQYGIHARIGENMQDPKIYSNADVHLNVCHILYNLFDALDVCFEYMYWWSKLKSHMLCSIEQEGCPCVIQGGCVCIQHKILSKRIGPTFLLIFFYEWTTSTRKYFEGNHRL